MGLYFGPDKRELVNVNDIVFVPSDCVVDALLSDCGGSKLLSLQTTRRDWTIGLDHCVTSGLVFVPFIKMDTLPQRDHIVASSPSLQVPAVKRSKVPKLPLNLLQRSLVLTMAAANMASSVGQLDFTAM